MENDNILLLNPFQSENWRERTVAEAADDGPSAESVRGEESAK